MPRPQFRTAFLHVFTLVFGIVGLLCRPFNALRGMHGTLGPFSKCEHDDLMVARSSINREDIHCISHVLVLEES